METKIGENDPINAALSRFAFAHNTTLNKVRIAFVGAIGSWVAVSMFLVGWAPIEFLGFMTLMAFLVAPCAYDLICNITKRER